jgi:hypothetical protein
VISHVATDGVSQGVLSAIGDVYQGATAATVPRTAAGIREFCTGLDLVEPGISQGTMGADDGNRTRMTSLATAM